MPATVGGLYLLAVAVVLLILAAVFAYASWEDFDDRRRRERLVHRNLQRMGGAR
jgi:hypothetical protein